MMMLLFNYIINVFISTESSLFTLRVENDSNKNLNYKTGEEIENISSLGAISIKVLNGNGRRLSPPGFELDLYVPNHQAEQDLHRLFEEEKLNNIRVELEVQFDAIIW